MLSLAVALMTASCVTAQENQDAGKNNKTRKMDPTEMIQKRTDAVVKKYGLDETQAKKLLELNTKYASTMRPRMMRPGGQRGENNGQRPELTDDKKAKMQERAQKMQEQRKAYEAELQNILTADQLKSYQADMQKRANRQPKDKNTKESK